MRGLNISQIEAGVANLLVDARELSRQVTPNAWATADKPARLRMIGRTRRIIAGANALAAETRSMTALDPTIQMRIARARARADMALRTAAPIRAMMVDSPSSKARGPRTIRSALATPAHHPDAVPSSRRGSGSGVRSACGDARSVRATTRPQQEPAGLDGGRLRPVWRDPLDPPGFPYASPRSRSLGAPRAAEMEDDELWKWLSQGLAKARRRLQPLPPTLRSASLPAPTASAPPPSSQGDLLIPLTRVKQRPPHSDGTPPTLRSPRQDSEVDAPSDESVEAFAQRFGRVWSDRRGGRPTPTAMTGWLVEDHRLTLKGALLRDANMRRAAARKRKIAYQPRIGADLATYSAAVTKAWKTSREQSMLFQLDKNPRVAPLRFQPPAARPTLATDPAVSGSDQAPVAALTSNFVRELKRRVPGIDCSTYPRHGSAGFVDFGLSVDLHLGQPAADGFYPKPAATALLRAVDQAAQVAGAEWRAIYNDFAVANAINTETGRRHVIYVGHPARSAGRVTGLVWHGPAPLILHVHVDLTPRTGPARGALPATGKAR